MDEAATEERERRWYHVLPSWWPVGAFILAGLVSGVEAYGQIADQGKRIDKLEQVSPELARNIAEIKAHQEDDSARLQRIEKTLDRAVILNSVPY